MADILKLRGQSIAISNVTPNTVSLAVVVRINHAGTGTTAIPINIANTGGVYASIYVNPQSSVFIEKQPADTVAANTTTSDITAVAVAFT